MAINTHTSEESADASIAELDALDAALAVVNLDELVIETVDVAILERTLVEEELPNGKKARRYEFTPRIAHIAALVTTEAQLRVYQEYQSLSDKTIAEQAEFMYQCVLDVWRETEPDMTLTELKGSGLDINRIAALFKRLFTPASRR